MRTRTCHGSTSIASAAILACTVFFDRLNASSPNSPTNAALTLMYEGAFATLAVLVLLVPGEGMSGPCPTLTCTGPSNPPAVACQS
jgi:hypothetical protein